MQTDDRSTDPREALRAEVRSATATALGLAMAEHERRDHGERPVPPRECLEDVAERMLVILGPWAAQR